MKALSPALLAEWERKRKRFWSRVTIRKPDECWLWDWYDPRRRYGVFWFGGRNVQASHVAWLSTHFELPTPPKELICHTCDNPQCVNPYHLFVGSMQVNMEDMISKGRKVTVRGSKHPLAKLKEQDVVEIIALLEGGLGITRLAKRYNVSDRLIWAISKGKAWPQITRHICHEAPPTSAPTGIPNASGPSPS